MIVYIYYLSHEISKIKTMTYYSHTYKVDWYVINNTTPNYT